MPQKDIKVSRQMRGILSKKSKLDINTVNICDHVSSVRAYRKHENRCYFRVAYMRLVSGAHHPHDEKPETASDSKKESDLRFINEKMR